MADTDFNIENLRIKDLPPMPEPNPAQYRQRAVKENLIGCPLWWLQCVLPDSQKQTTTSCRYLPVAAADRLWQL